LINYPDCLAFFEKIFLLFGLQTSFLWTVSCSTLRGFPTELASYFWTGCIVTVVEVSVNSGIFQFM